jgi:hypothetical protein
MCIDSKLSESESRYFQMISLIRIVGMLVCSKMPSLLRKTILVICCATIVAISGCKKSGIEYAQGPQMPHLDFNQDVQPILASNCFSCHGPDPAARKAGLRLDLEESAFRKRPGKPDAIVPGHPDQSEMIRRIESKDSHYLMPQDPRGSAKPMKPQEIAILRQWIAEGAHYKPHWAFDKPMRSALPKVPNAERFSNWTKNPIDAFVLAGLDKEGLHPSPEADKRTLIRRVTLDLTGLLPTPSEVTGYLQDNSSQAYEHLVDRLLAKPGYGEQRARYWLDYVRYADTYGLHFDNNRHIWPYRDYLIRSFNENKPFDQFAKEQIAGDLMPVKNIDQIIATGYVRSGVSSNEGGTIPEELRFNIARERAEAYGGAFLGLTVGCAVCHDHKYDPTTQKDFYQLTAFFNNLNEQPFNNDKPDWAPVLRIPKEQNRAAYDRILRQRSVLQGQLDQARLQEKTLIQRWLEAHKEPAHPVSTDKLQLRLRLDEGGGDILKNSAPNANPKSFEIGKSKPQWGETTWIWPDFRMDTNTHIMLGQMGDFEWNQPFSLGGWFMLRLAPNFGGKDVTGALVSKMNTDQQNRGWELATEKGIISVSLVNVAPKKPGEASVLKTQAIKASAIKASEIKVSTLKPMADNGQWTYLFFTYDGSGKASGVSIYVDGTKVATKNASDTLDHETIRTSAPMQLGRIYPDDQPARDTRYQDLRLYARTVTQDEVRRLPFEDYVAEITGKSSVQWDQDQWHAVSQFYFKNIDQGAMAASAQIKQLNAQLDKLSTGGDLTLVSEEKPSIAYADILTRGIYSARKERVEADTPHFLPPLPAGMPHNRLALAEWTVGPENPLTA